jgi:hypothetical protein
MPTMGEWDEEDKQLVAKNHAGAGLDWRRLQGREEKRAEAKRAREQEKAARIVFAKQ